MFHLVFSGDVEETYFKWSMGEDVKEETGRGMGTSSRAGWAQPRRGAGSRPLETLPGAAALGGSVLRCRFDY